MTYTGTIIEESIKDNRLLNQLEIVGVHISSDENPDDRWHLYKVKIDEDKISKLSEQLRPEKWYMHFWNGDLVIAVFPNKIFRFNHSDKSTWAEAIEYGKSLGIPEEQLDFITE